MYAVTDRGALGGKTSAGHDINAAGDVVGTSEVAGPAGHGHGYGLPTAVVALDAVGLAP